MTAIEKKQAILDGVFKTKDGLSWNELTQELNELIELSNQSYCNFYKKPCIGKLCSVTPYIDLCKYKGIVDPPVSGSALYKKLENWFEEQHLIKHPHAYLNTIDCTLGDRFEEIREFLNYLRLDCNDH